MNNKFRIALCSDLDYEEMVADIYYEGHAIGMITQENGIERMQIKIYHISDGTVDVPLDDYMEALVAAKKRLISSQKPPDS